MIRTTVYIDEEIHFNATEIARARGMNFSRLVGEILGTMTGQLSREELQAEYKAHESRMRELSAILNCRLAQGEAKERIRETIIQRDKGVKLLDPEHKGTPLSFIQSLIDDDKDLKRIPREDREKIARDIYGTQAR